MSDHQKHAPRTGPELVALEAELPTTRLDTALRDAMRLGLPSAPSVQDPTVSTFARTNGPCFSGINTMFKLPFVEDAARACDYDVAFVGVPLDTATTYRPGARFGPMGIRRASAVYASMYAYALERGVDLFENVSMCDLGDVFVLGDLERSFDQISHAVAHTYNSGCFPVMIGGDHSIGYPDIRGLAPYIDGKIGIIHIDRHLDTGPSDLDARMHSCPWYHACKIDNVPGANLVQIGIGGWQVSRHFIRGARERGTHIITMDEVEHHGIEKVAEMALEIAWKDAEAVYMSFDIDAMDGGFAPGTGWPQPGGFFPRDVLKLQRLVAAEGLCGYEVVEVAPDADINDVTSILAVNAILEVLASLYTNGHLPTRRKPQPDAKLDAWVGS